MTREELSKWFIDKLKMCYLVINDDFPYNIFLYYDENIIRKNKLCKLNNIEFNIDKITGLCLFKIDYEYNYLYCAYDEIWSFFENNYSEDYYDIQKFIKYILKYKGKFSNLVPGYTKLNYQKNGNKLYNVSELTPQYGLFCRDILFKNKDKLKLLS